MDIAGAIVIIFIFLVFFLILFMYFVPLGAVDNGSFRRVYT